jgi:hypothetical protein
MASVGVGLTAQLGAEFLACLLRFIVDNAIALADALLAFWLDFGEACKTPQRAITAICSPDVPRNPSVRS